MGNTRAGKLRHAQGRRSIKFDAEGLQRAEIARRTGIGVASVYRVPANAKRSTGGRVSDTRNSRAMS